MRSFCIALFLSLGLSSCGAPLSQLSNPAVELPPQELIDGAVSVSITNSALSHLATSAGDMLSLVFPTTASGWICVALDDVMPGGLPPIPFSVGPFDTNIEVREASICVDPVGITLELVPNQSPPTLRLHTDQLHMGFENPVIIAGTTQFLGLESSAACVLENNKITDDGTPYAIVLTLTVDIELTVDDSGQIGVTTTTHEFVLDEVGVSVKKDCTLPECTDPNLGGIIDSCVECEICTTADFGSDITSLVVELLGDVLDPIVAVAVDVLTKPLIDEWLNGQMMSIAGQISLSNVLGTVTDSLQSAEDLRIVNRTAPNGLKTVDFGNETVLQLHTRGGTYVEKSHSCVGPIPSAPTFTPGPFPMMVGLSQDGVQYDVAVALSEAFLNQVVWSFYRSGSLCLGLNTRELATLTQGKLQLRTGPLDILVPGVATLAGRDASVRFRFLPTLEAADLPILQVGTSAEGDLRLQWPGFGLALEAFVDNDYMRLMTIRADVAVALDVMTQGNDLTLSFGELTVENLLVSDNEAFAEMDIEAVISLGLEVALSVLSGANGLVIPAIPTTSDGGALPLTLVGLDAVGANDDWLALYLVVAETPGNKPGSDPVDFNQAIDVVNPGAVTVRGRWKTTDPVWARVDGLMWHRVASMGAKNGERIIEHPLLRIPGKHEVALRWGQSQAVRTVRIPDRVATVPESSPITSTVKRDRGCSLGARGEAPWWLLLALLVGYVLRRWKRVLVGALVVIGLTGCTVPTSPGIVCEHHVDCPSGTTCDANTGLCVVPSPCQLDGECCPGLMCMDGVCRSMEECTKDGDCLGLDDRCQKGLCVASACQSADDCQAPYHQCLANRCVRSQPCAPCAPNTICEPSTGRCVSVEGTCANLNCPDGSQAMVTGESIPWGHDCSAVAEDCDCVAMEGVESPIPSAWVNVLTSLEPSGYRHTVVARDLRYGDLVALSMAPDGTIMDTDYLDGVPEGPIVFDSTGRRGGIVEPGNDVGRFAAAVSTSLGFSAVARDETRGVLRFVARGDSDTALAYDLDALDDTGYGTSMTVASDHSLHVSSFAVNDSGMLLLRYFQTPPGVDMPVNVGSWTATTIPIDLGPVETIEMCAPGCELFEACVEVDGVATCKTPDWTHSCASKCPIGHSCVEAVCRRVIRDKAGLKPWRDVPRGETATTSAGDQIVIAYENHRLGTLNLWFGSAQDGINASPEAVDGGQGDRVGRHLAMAGHEDGTMALAYQDTTRGLLKLVWGVPAQGLTPWNIEPGGKGIAIQFTSDGRLVLAHGLGEGQGVRVLVGLPNDWAIVDPMFTPHVGRFNALSLMDGVATLVSVRNQITAAWNPEVVLETAAIAVE